MMMKRVSMLFMAVTMAAGLFAQKVEDGVRFLYYERYKSAKETLEKIVSAEPGNAEAVYWLGQTLIKMKDTAAVKNLYQQALAANANEPLILVGMGQVMLMEGRTNEARQQFETAINLTKKKDIENIVNAVARANVEARAGDATYAIEKLKPLTEAKRFSNAQTYLLMGDAYRKLIDGGNAVSSYNKALELDPKLAAAKNRIGKIYETQENPEFYLPAYEQATQIDPAYAPAYFNLFYHYYFRDVNKAGEYLNKYIANTDQGPEMEYIKTDYTYAKGDFAAARQRAEQLIQEYGDRVNPRMYRMVAYTADTLGDTEAARDAMVKFLATADEETILPTDYEQLAKIYAKLPDMRHEVYANYEKAIALDTVHANKVKLIQNAAALARSTGDLLGAADWLGKAYSLEKEPTQRDLYNWAYAYYQAAAYEKADSLFCSVYIPSYPDEIYGYLWCARAKMAQDTTMEKGLAVEANKMLAQKAIELDTSANKQLKPYAINSLFYLVSYYNDIAREKDTAIAYNDKVLEIDPTNENALRVKKILTAPPPKTQSSPADRPRSTAANRN